jgi:hypothetical protein
VALAGEIVAVDRWGPYLIMKSGVKVAALGRLVSRVAESKPKERVRYSSLHPVMSAAPFQRPRRAGCLIKRSGPCGLHFERSRGRLVTERARPPITGIDLELLSESLRLTAPWLRRS